MDDLRLQLARAIVGEEQPELLPMWAAEALAAGMDSPAVRELAGLSGSDTQAASELLLQAAAELGVKPPDEAESRVLAARSWAEDIRKRRLTPRRGAGRIWWRCESGEIPEGAHFVNAACSWDDMPDRRAEIEEEIRAAARQLVARLSSP